MSFILLQSKNHEEGVSLRIKDITAVVHQRGTTYVETEQGVRYYVHESPTKVHNLIKEVEKQ